MRVSLPGGVLLLAVLGLAQVALPRVAAAEEIAEDLAARLTPAQQRAYLAYRAGRTKFDRETRAYWRRADAKRRRDLNHATQQPPGPITGRRRRRNATPAILRIGSDCPHALRPRRP